MSWSNIDDRIMSHPKMKRACKLKGDAAWCLWSRGLVYTNAYDLDGRVPRDVIDELTADRKPFDVAQTLVDCGLWELRDDGDYQVHDYAEYNETRAVKEARRKASKERLKKHRDKRAGIEQEVPPQHPDERDGNEDETRFTHGAPPEHERGTKEVIPTYPYVTHTKPSSSGATAPAAAPVRSDDPSVQAILDKLASEPALATLATLATADKLAAHVHAGTKRLAWVLRAIEDYAADATIAGPQVSDTRFASGLRKYVEACRAPSEPASGLRVVPGGNARPDPLPRFGNALTEEEIWGENGRPAQ